jgi:hypothetical protein
MKTTASRIDKHLRELEGVNPTEGLVLHFKDGSTRFFRIHKNSVLGLVCASMHLMHFVSCPEEYTPEALKIKRARKDVPPNSHSPDREDPATGRPITKYDFLLELLGKAERISGPAAHHLVVEAWSLCRMAAETVRRGKRFSFTRENVDPFFGGCRVGPYAPDVEARIQKAGNVDHKSAVL